MSDEIGTSKEELNEFFVLSLDMLCIASYEGFFTRINPAWETTLGHTQAELMARPFLDYVHPDDKEATLASWIELLAGQKVRNFENRYLCKDGSWKWLLWQAARSDEQKFICATAHEITGFREMREQLRMQTESLDEAQQVAHIGNWEWNILSDATTWSAELFRIFGVTPAQVTPSYAGFLELVHPDDRMTVQAAVTRCLTNKEPISYEFKTNACAEKLRVMHARCSAVLDESGNLVKLVGTSQDITERHQAEAALRVSEERFQIVLQATHDVIWDWDVVTNAHSMSDSFGKSFGYETGSYPETMEFWVECLHPDDHARMMQNVEILMASDADAMTAEYRFRCADGSYADVLDRATVKRDSLGVVTRMVGSMMNVTVQKMHERELQEAKLAAEDASRAKGEFLANVSHEIRTPMNGVLGTIGLLLKTDLAPPQRELAGIAQASGEALLHLVNDILDFSKFEAGMLTLESIPFDLLRVAQEVSGVMSALASAKDLELVLLFPPNVPRRVIGDPSRIRQVLSNLVSNAIKFTERGKVILELATEGLEEDAVALRFRVSDTGVGIAEEQLGYIFEKFTQADPSITRRHGGTGLGLAISSRLVHEMGGTLGVKSLPGKGSSFTFTLCLALQKEEQSPLLPPESLESVRVLIGDDNEIGRRSLAHRLASGKMRQTTVETPREALQLLHEAHASGDPFQLVIVNDHGSHADWEGLGRTIKANLALQNVDLIMLASHGYRGDVARLRRIGFSGYIVGPSQKVEVLDALLQVWSARIQGQKDTMITRHTLVEREAHGEQHSQTASQHLVSPHVLLVDDHPTNRLVASMMLQSLGCWVEVASDGRQAVEMLRRASYDLVFMDCAMPVMDGFQATAEIRTNEAGSNRTPVIAITAQAMHGDRERCLQAGMDDYLSKPIRSEELDLALEKWVPEWRASRANSGSKRWDPADVTVSDFGQKVLDPSVLKDLHELAANSDPTLLVHVFRSFREDGAARLVLIRDAAKAGDYETLQKIAHAFIGAAANIGAIRLAAQATQLEELAESSPPTELTNLVLIIEKEFGRVTSQIDLILQKIQSDGPGS